MVVHAIGKNTMQPRADQNQTRFQGRLGGPAGGTAFALLLTGRDCR